MDSKLKNLVDDWLRWAEPDSDDFLSVENDLKAGNHEKLSKDLQGRLTFGTAGIRGLMAPG